MLRRWTVRVMCVAVLAGACPVAVAEDVDVCPGNIGSGSLSAPSTAWAGNAAWLNPTGYDFATNRHSLDLTTYNGGSPVALQGFIDVSSAPLAESGEYTKYYAQWVIRDVNDRWLQVTYGTDWLGDWHGCDAQPADRIRLENYDGATWDSATAPSGTDYDCMPEEYYLTEGGTHDMGGGGPVYPTDRKYYMQLIYDPSANSINLEVYGKGNAGAQAPPNSNNCVDYKQWYCINDDPDYSCGPIVFDPQDFDFAQVEIYANLSSSDKVDPGDSVAYSWQCANLGDPLTSGQTPVPEPMTLGLLALGGVGALVGRRRRRALTA